MTTDADVLKLRQSQHEIRDYLSRAFIRLDKLERPRPMLQRRQLREPLWLWRLRQSRGGEGE